MYIPLRIVTHTSIGLSTLTAQTVANWAAENNIPAVGVAERNTLAGSLGTSKAMVKKGVQPLMGAAVRLTYDLDETTLEGDVVVYARTDAGYSALLKTLNQRSTSSETMSLATFVGAMEHAQEDVIILTGGRSGLLNVVGSTVLDYLKNFSNVYVEIERTSSFAEDETHLFQAAQDYNRPLVATSPMVCESAQMKDSHEAYLCIASKSYLDDLDHPTLEEGAWLVDADTFADRFKDIPNAVQATLDIAKMCTTFQQATDAVPPAYTFTNGEHVDTYINTLANEGLQTRLVELKSGGANIDDAVYQDRLDHEIALISKMGFSGYFLIVSDFINWARKNNIPVGPGRGSGAGSLVAYSLRITDIDPLAFGLLFERFLNPDRVSMPDFDIDFSQARRGEVISYVRNRYGEANVAHIGTYAVLQARAAVRGVGRVMGLPFHMVDKYSKMIPQNPTDPITLQDAMDTPSLAEELENADESIYKMFQLALKVEGLYAHLSTHAAGVVISDKPIADIVPVHLDDNGMVTTSFDMKDVEASGLVKFDFLGLKNLDIIDEAISFAKFVTGTDVALDTVTFKDSAAYEMLASGDGFGVFQVESAGMRRAMRQLNVDTIEDLIALISLYRPGPMDQIQTYADVKAGVQDLDYLHEGMANVLDETHGVMIYQEQVMQIARDLGGYTLGEADLLRRAMGKKIKEDMDGQRETFVEGAQSGWVTVTLDNGTTTRLHSRTKVVVNDGTGQRVSLETAMLEDLDILI
jgi:DNA polymerase-3 subunit alpha